MKTVTWDDWKLVFQSTAVWRPVIETIWSRQASTLQFPAEPVRTTRAGFPGTCAVFVVNESAVVKIFPPMVAGDFERERHVLRFLDRRLAHIPQFLAAGRVQEAISWPYLVFSYHPGPSWRDVDQPGATLGIAIAHQLGAWLRELHGLPAKREEMTWSRPPKWPAFVQKRLASLGDELRQRTQLSSRVIELLVARLRRADWEQQSQALLHADLTAEHILLSGQDNDRLGMVIDWADAEVGDPRYEWPALFFGFCNRDWELFSAVAAAYGIVRPDSALITDLFHFTLLHRFGAAIIGDVLTAAEQKSIDSVEEIRKRLLGLES